MATPGIPGSFHGRETGGQIGGIGIHLHNSARF
jgi:hypothetical protein